MRLKSRLLIVSILVITGTVLLAFRSDNKYFDIARNLDIFTTLFKEVNAYYVDEVEPEPIIHRGIDSMLASLDPYTVFIPEDEAENYRSMTTGQYGGIGIMVGDINGKAYVTMLYENFAAHKAGINIGDQIIEINDKSVVGKNPDEVTRELKGAPNSDVSIKVKRIGKDSPIQFDLKRSKVIVNNVSHASMLDKEIGYIILSDFTFGASREVINALNQLKEKGAKKIILDLRSNPGGLLSEAINVANVFIPRGQDVVHTKGKLEEWNKTYKALNMPTDVEIPIAVLVNGGSASASEIVAGVIQDYDRGVLIGRKTFGKGLVQTTRPLSYNTQLKVTTAKYYTPSGRCIQRLDYANKNKGKATSLADSLLEKFSTLNGRTVNAGGGLTPDITVEGRRMAEITQELVFQGKVFEYASIYCSNHDQIVPAREFKITDSEYAEFKDWMLKSSFKYKTQIDHMMDEMKQTAKSENLYGKLENQLKELRADIEQNKLNDFDKHKDEIKLILQKEIVSRYYLFNGDVQATMDHDNDINKAKEILSNDAVYNNILNSNGVNTKH